MVNAASDTMRLSRRRRRRRASERIGTRLGAQGRPVGELGGGRLAPAAEARAHGVDGEPAAERQERRPDDQLAQHPVAAVLDQRHARVQADEADRRQEAHQRRPPPDQERQVDEAADRRSRGSPRRAARPGRRTRTSTAWAAARAACGSARGRRSYRRGRAPESGGSDRRAGRSPPPTRPRPTLRASMVRYLSDEPAAEPASQRGARRRGAGVGVGGGRFGNRRSWPVEKDALVRVGGGRLVGPGALLLDHVDVELW